MRRNDISVNPDHPDALMRYYSCLRVAVLDAQKDVTLHNSQHVVKVLDVLSNLAALILERSHLDTLEDIRRLDPEFRGSAILVLLQRDRPEPARLLQWYSDRMHEFGGPEKLLADPDIKTIADLRSKLSDYEEWIP